MPTWSDSLVARITTIHAISSWLKFEDTKGVIRIRKSTKDRQCNGQMNKDKKTNNDLQNTTQKAKNSATQFNWGKCH